MKRLSQWLWIHEILFSHRKTPSWSQPRIPDYKAFKTFWFSNWASKVKVTTLLPKRVCCWMQWMPPNWRYPVFVLSCCLAPYSRGWQRVQGNHLCFPVLPCQIVPEWQWVLPQDLSQMISMSWSSAIGSLTLAKPVRGMTQRVGNYSQPEPVFCPSLCH